MHGCSLSHTHTVYTQTVLTEVFHKLGMCVHTVNTHTHLQHTQTDLQMLIFMVASLIPAACVSVCVLRDNMKQ